MKVQKYNGIPLPAIIELSLVDSCTRACEICPRKSLFFAPKNNVEMDTELVLKLALELDDIKYSGTVVFSGFSEPLMHTEIFEVVQILKDYGPDDFRIELVTNGDLLTKDKLNKLYLEGVDGVFVSVYDQKRLPTIENMFIGVDKSRYEIRKRWEPFLVTNRGGVLNSEGRSGPCYYTAYLSVIDWNGDVLPCPHDWNRRVKFGNLNYELLISIWSKPEFVEHRKQLFKDRSVISPCNRCNCKGTIRGKEHKEAWCKY